MPDRAHRRRQARQARRTRPSALAVLPWLDGSAPPPTRTVCSECAGPIAWVDLAHLEAACPDAAGIAAQLDGPVDCWVCDDPTCTGLGVIEAHWGWLDA